MCRCLLLAKGHAASYTQTQAHLNIASHYYGEAGPLSSSVGPLISVRRPEVPDDLLNTQRARARADITYMYYKIRDLLSDCNLIKQQVRIQAPV